MNNEKRAYELSDEQLEAATGGSLIPAINIQTNVSTPINVSTPVSNNTILFSNVSGSSIGSVHTNQSNQGGQSNRIK